MAAMLNVLAIEGTDESTWEKRLEIYFTALSDVPPDLLERASLECIKSETFFPKVAVIRGKVDAALKLRRNQLARANWLVANRATSKPGEAFVPEPEADRLRAAIKRWQDNPDHFFARNLWKAAVDAERRLAVLEERTPRDFALEQITKPVEPIHPSPAPMKPEPPPTIEGEYSRVDDEPPPRSGDDLEW